MWVENDKLMRRDNEWSVSGTYKSINGPIFQQNLIKSGDRAKENHRIHYIPKSAVRSRVDSIEVQEIPSSK